MIVSLPSNWIKKYGISKGDEVEVIEKGSAVEITVGNAVDFGIIELDVSGLSTQLIEASIKSAYIQGFEEMLICFPRPFIEISGQTVPVRKIVRETVSRLLAVEITAESSTSCTVKELASSSPKEFDNVMRRAFLILTELVSSIAANPTKLEEESLKDDCDTIHKLINYCLRCINRYGYHQFRKSHSLYNILAVANLLAEQVGVYVEASKVNKGDALLLECVSSAMKHYSAFFFSFHQESLLEIARLHQEFFQINQNQPGSMTSGSYRLANMMSLIWSMTQYRIAMQ